MASRMARFEQYLSETAQADHALMMGCIHVYRATGKALYRDYVVNQAARGNACGLTLLFAMEKSGDEALRQQVEQLAAQPMDVQRLEEAYEVLPFRMMYEVKLNKLAWVSRVTEQFRSIREKLRHEGTGLYGAAEGEAFTPVSTGWYLAALVDGIDACEQQLYEHWRALVDIFREALRGLLRSGSTKGAEALVAYSMLKAVRMGIIDPERYLPMAMELAENMDESAGMGAYMMAWAELQLANEAR